MPTLAAADEGELALDRLRLRVGVEVAVATAVVAGAIALVDLLANLWPALAGWSGAAVALTFLGLPLLIGAWRRLRADPLGIGRRPLRGAVALGVGVSLAVLLPFVLAYDGLQVQYLHRIRWAGPGLQSYGLEFQQPLTPHSGRVSVTEHGVALALHNGLDRAIQLAPTCTAPAGRSTCRGRTLAPGQHGLLTPMEARSTRIMAADGQPLDAPLWIAGQAASAPLIAQERGWTWLLWLLLTQLVVVALPEEAFFRGYVLGRLLQAWPARRTVFGAPFGAAHVASAALFAAIHLVATPAPHRLLVFFPGLLFAWLASRARTSIASTVHHALANVMLQVVSRIYG